MVVTWWVGKLTYVYMCFQVLTQLGGYANSSRIKERKGSGGRLRRIYPIKPNNVMSVNDKTSLIHGKHATEYTRKLECGPLGSYIVKTPIAGGTGCDCRTNVVS